MDGGKGNYTLGNKPNMSKKTSTKTKALGTFKSDKEYYNPKFFKIAKNSLNDEEYY